jgi:adenine-specific DNA-methyltransferase
MLRNPCGRTPEGMSNSTARALRKRPTEAESKLWAGLRELGPAGYKFRRQSPVGRYVCDFVCFSRKLIVEVDGSQHAENTVGDQQRTKWLESRGFRVLRFWNGEVLRDAQTVLDVIFSVLQESDDPLPPPAWLDGIRRGVF